MFSDGGACEAIRGGQRTGQSERNVGSAESLLDTR